jgi:hypothetical protein
MSYLRPTTKEFLSSSDDSVEAEFFARVFLPNRTVKTTYAKRLDDVNEVILKHVIRLDESPAKLMDVGVSSGTSTAEWSDQLTANKIDFEMTGTDLTIDAYLYSYSQFALLFDAKGNLMHFDLFGSGWPPYQHGIHFHFFRQLFARSVIGCASALRRGVERTHVQLLSRRLAANCSFKTVEDDLNGPSPQSFQSAFHVIRAANVLNLSYFPESSLRVMLANLKGRLKENGVLIVCRTSGTINNGTVFRLSSSQLVPVERIGAGSEIEPLVAFSHQ